MQIKISELREKIIMLLKNMSAADAAIVADYLVWAEMSGISTQGIVKLSGNSSLQNIIPKHPIKIERETGVSAVLDGGINVGILVSDRAAEIAIEKARANGIAIVGVRNIFSSNGAQSYYVEKIARADLVGIMCSRSPGTVAPFGSIDPLFGTNPVGYAFPTTGDPIVFDAATSAMTFYGLVVAKARGEKIPAGIGTDKNGNPTINPGDVIDGGAVTPFGNSYKAAGFGMLVELLSGPLIGGAFLDYKTFDQEWGATIIAINPAILTDLDKFKKSCSEFVATIRNSRTRAGGKIRMPHDQARRLYASAAATGMVEVDDVIYNSIFK